MDSSNEYSLDTPKLNNNILTSKILNLIQKNNVMIGGNENNLNNSNNTICVIIIGLILIILGFYLCWDKNNYIQITGQIQNISCDKSKYLPEYLSECRFNLTYIVGTTQYSKVITMNEKAIPSTNTIQIYYQETDPNIIKLHDLNYNIIGIILIIIGSLILVSKLYCSNYSNNIIESNIPESKLYTELNNLTGIVYSK